jgi:hypothetical protein
MLRSLPSLLSLTLFTSFTHSLYLLSCSIPSLTDSMSHSIHALNQSTDLLNPRTLTFLLMPLNHTPIAQSLKSFTLSAHSHTLSFIHQHFYSIYDSLMYLTLLTQSMSFFTPVLDLASWVRIAVLMNVYLGLGNSGGSGF